MIALLISVLRVYVRKAKRCYQKAFELDRQSPAAGSGYVQIMLTLDEKVRSGFYVTSSIIRRCRPVI